MLTHTDSLPAAKSSRANSIAFAPGAQPGLGVLTIDVKRNACEYAVVAMETPWAGRGFVLAKIDQGTDEETTGYECFVATAPGYSTCECRGFLRWGGCKHLAALQTIVDNGWL